MSSNQFSAGVAKREADRASLREKIVPANKPAEQGQQAEQPKASEQVGLNLGEQAKAGEAPAAAAFRAPPPNMTAGQKAAWTRAQRAAGVAPAPTARGGKKVQQAAPQVEPRKEGLELVLHIRDQGGMLAVGFGWSWAPGTDGERKLVGFFDTPEHERDIEKVGLRASASAEGRLYGFQSCMFAGGLATVATIKAVLPIMERVDSIMDAARIESEDESFAQAILALATGLRVTRIEWDAPDCETVSAKRGAAYITAHKAAEAFLARRLQSESKAA